MIPRAVPALLACLLTAAPLAAELIPVLPDLPSDYADLALPEHYLENQIPDPSPFQSAAIDNDSTPADNPTTDDGATLGRVLFYDIKLSANGTVACASCHVQANGFGDTRRLSLGFEGGSTRRHSMGLTNAVFNQSGKYFWDERAASLEEQVLMPFQDATEMGLTLEQLVSIVSTQDYYPPLFANAFGDATIDADRIARALAQFVRSLVSVNSRYDQGRATVDSPLAPFPNFSNQENLGKNIFFGVNRPGPSCIDCHVTEAFISPGLLTPHASTTTGATNNGLDRVSTDDLGIAETTGNVSDTGRFRVPSLRNIAVRAPFMHDGRFDTLAEVMVFFDRDIQPHAQLAQLLRTPNGQVARIRMNNNERAAVVAFLETLTDPTLLTDLKFSNPFVDVPDPAEDNPADDDPVDDDPDPADPEPDPAPTDPVRPVLANVSSRAVVRHGSEPLISGFVITGDAPKTLLLRGIGPRLADFGVASPLTSPVLRLFAGTEPIAAAGPWADQDNSAAITAAAQRLGAFALDPDGDDSAMLITLPPGAYTAHLLNQTPVAGEGLIEVYDADRPRRTERSRLTNLSVRTVLAPGGELLVPGFVVTGDAPRTFLIRAIGPTLTDFGVPNALADPRLTVISAGATVTTNNDWSSAGNATQTDEATRRVGAFALPAGSRDASTSIALPPGAYSVLVDGADRSGGALLIEIYALED